MVQGLNQAVVRQKSSYNINEEIANSVSHGLGVALSITGLVLLIVYSVSNGNGYHIVSSTIFGATLIILYSTSTLYHALSQPKLKLLFQKLDHSAIYLLIAGTYTPYTLVTLRGGLGWLMFGIVWGLAIGGCLLELLLKNLNDRFSLILYIALGWVIIFAIGPMIARIDTGGLIFLIAGGLSYSFGTFFYTREKKAYSHAIWHLFVLGGSICHFFSIFYFVIPGS